MVRLRPDPVIIDDERVKALMFDMLALDAPSSLTELVERHFNGDVGRLIGFLLELDDFGLAIRGNKT